MTKLTLNDLRLLATDVGAKRLGDGLYEAVAARAAATDVFEDIASAIAKRVEEILGSRPIPSMPDPLRVLQDPLYAEAWAFAWLLTRAGEEWWHLPPGEHIVELVSNDGRAAELRVIESPSRPPGTMVLDLLGPLYHNAPLAPARLRVTVVELETRNNYTYRRSFWSLVP